MKIKLDKTNPIENLPISLQSIDQIELKIKAEVFKKQIRVKEFFSDFDRLKKGTVNEDKVFRK